MYITIIYNGNIDSNDSIDWIDLKTAIIKLKEKLFFYLNINRNIAI